MGARAVPSAATRCDAALVALAHEVVEVQTSAEVVPFDAEGVAVPELDGPGGAAKTDSGGELALSPARPNPARGATELSLTLPQSAELDAAVFDALGRRVAVLADGPMAEGAHALRLDARALPAGVYVVRVVVRDGGTEALTRRVTVVR